MSFKYTLLSFAFIVIIEANIQNWSHLTGIRREYSVNSNSRQRHDNLLCRLSAHKTENKNINFNLSALRFFAGGAAATVASVVTCPLEVIKIQMQSSNAIGLGTIGVLKKILDESGPSGLFSGLGAFLLGIVPNRAAYFWAYTTSKDLATSKYGNLNAPITHLISAFVAGIASNTLTNPIWVVKTRLQLLADPSKGQIVYSGWLDATKWIYREEGLKGFYKGISASYWGCSEFCIQFVCYEALKKRALAANPMIAQRSLSWRKEKTLKSHQYFIMAGSSKLLATVLTYPYMVARTRMREQAASGIFKYHGMWPTLNLVAREEGWRSLYSGLGIHLARALPHSAIMLMSYELLDIFIKKLVDHNSL